MRRKIVAGNWKMNTSLQEGIELSKAIASEINSEQLSNDVRVILGVPFTHIVPVCNEVENSAIGVAAQNCSVHESGAYTGEISASMIESTGATYCIIGHSECRLYHNESDVMLASKVKLALKNNLIPIFCCGETIEIRKNEEHFEHVNQQLQNGLFHLSSEDFSKVIIAYEPIWAIGTGLTASPEQAQEMHRNIREQVKNQYNAEIADNTSILYGGSCKPTNAKELFLKQDVDGGLIGGASLKVNDFLNIIRAL